jgi:hypothetical protein
MIGDLDRTAWFTDIIIRQQSGRVVSVVLMPSSCVFFKHSAALLREARARIN